jgi:aldose 1-epimerase
LLSYDNRISCEPVPPVKLELPDDQPHPPMTQPPSPDDPAPSPMTRVRRGAVLTLRSGRARLTIAPELGGSITRYWWQDGQRSVDWLRPTSADALARLELGAGACFPLVPYSNRIRDGRFAFRDRQIVMPPATMAAAHAEHGHGWAVPWSVVERGDDRARLEYLHHADAWPFPYLAWQTFALTPDALTVAIGICNQGEEPMPCGLGLHPHFPRTPATRLGAAVRRMWRTDADVLPVELVDLPPGLNLGGGLEVDRIDLDTAFAGWSGSARIDWPEWHAGLTLRASPSLGFLVVYTPAGESYFCAEPVSNCTDAFNLAAAGRTDTGMVVLAPGERLEGVVTFRPEIARPRV